MVLFFCIILWLFFLISSKKYQTPKLNTDAMAFGHTHISYNEKFGDFTVLNPINIKYVRIYGAIGVENSKIETAVCAFFNIM